MRIRKAEQHVPTSLRAIAKRVIFIYSCTKRVILRSLVRENRTQGSARGRPGNWPFYLDVRQAQLGASYKVKVFIGQSLTSSPYRVLRESW